jgi:hypothetical protein
MQEPTFLILTALAAQPLHGCRYYRLSDDGAGALAAQADRLRRHAAAAQTLLLRRRPGTAGLGVAAS